MVYSHEVERQFIAGLLKLPDQYSEVCSFIDSSDFYSEVNQVIYNFIRSSYDNSEALDNVILSEKIRLSGISFEDNINVSDYIHSLMLRQISKSAF